MREFITTALTENQVGVLNRITSVYLRRKINIESLRVHESSITGMRLLVISCFTTKEQIDKIVKNIRNIIGVMDVKYYDICDTISQDIAVFKVKTSKVDDLAKKYGLRVLDHCKTCSILETTNTREGITEIADSLKELGVLIDYTRSGGVFLELESKEEA